jgi:hypothetical protein
MKALLLALLLTSCSSGEFSLENEEGCHTANSVYGDDCGPGGFWRTECTLPLAYPWNSTGCHSPNGKKLSTVWCCTNGP